MNSNFNSESKIIRTDTFELSNSNHNISMYKPSSYYSINTAELNSSIINSYSYDTNLKISSEFYIKSSSNINYTNNESSHHSHKLNKPYIMAAGCSGGASEVVKNIAAGIASGDSIKSNDIPNLIAKISDQFNSDAGVNDISGYYRNGNNICAAYVGAMYYNKEASSRFIVGVAISDVLGYGMPNARYYEYIDSDNAMKTIGIVCVRDDNNSLVQNTIKAWSENKSAWSVNGWKSYTINRKQPLCFLDYAKRKQGNKSVDSNYGTCDSKDIKSGQSASDACGEVSGDVLSYYNIDINFSLLQPGQPVCCSLGNMPDRRPKKNSDGSCFVHTFAKDESCSMILAKYYPLSMDDLMKYNKNTFGWYGCDNGHPWVDDKICLSDGTPPKPAVNKLAECGPQAPGDKYNAKCPLNVCCSEYGFCGLTDEFCTNKKSPTGAPGTTGCLSNCGASNFPMSPVSNFKRVAYYQGDDPSSANKVNINTFSDKYDIIHLAFGNLASDHKSIDISKIQTEFNNMKSIKAKKVLSLGGWDFSTSPQTYNIFRDAVSKDSDTFTNTVVAFLLNNSFLDGIDFDWEYPGAPDIPGIPPDDVNNCKNFLNFLKMLRERLNSNGLSQKTLSVAIPSSFWYLKPYPIQEMLQTIDYAVIMTYDLHGQWDYANKFSGGNHVFCHTNKTETIDSLKLLVRSKADISKVYVGEANYGRSYKLDKSCLGIDCTFVGPNSQATPGKYSKVAGILTDDDIRDIRANDKTAKVIGDDKSNCYIMNYNNNNEWTAWTQFNDARDTYYKSIGFGGSSLWSLNYATNGLNEGDTGSDDDHDTSLDEDPDEPEYNGIIPFNLNFCPYILTELSTLEDVNNIRNTFPNDVYPVECNSLSLLYYYLNNATNSLYEVNKLKNGDYNKIFGYYSDYFAKNMSKAYQEWGYYHMKTEVNDWFLCYDKNTKDLVSCYDVYLKGGSKDNDPNLCAKNCCHGIGCPDENNKCPVSSTKDKCNKCCDINNECQNAGLRTYSQKEDQYTQQVIANTLNDPSYRNSFYIDEIEYYNNEIREMNEIVSLKLDNDNIFLYGWQINPQYRDTAFKSLSDYVGYNVNSGNQFYRQIYYVFQDYLGDDDLCPKDNKNNITLRCVDLLYDKLFRSNPMDYFSDATVTNLTQLIDNAYYSINNGLDTPENIIEALDSTLAYTNLLYQNVLQVYNFGKLYHNECRRRRIMEILGPLFDALCIITFFLGEIEGILANIILTAIESGVTGDFSAASFFEAALGGGGKIFKLGKAKKPGEYHKATGLNKGVDMPLMGKKVKNIIKAGKSFLNKGSSDVCKA